MTMLHALECDQVDKVVVGQFTAKRWAWNLSRFTRLRATLPPDRFHDMGYRTLLHDPIPGKWDAYSPVSARHSQQRRARQ